MTLLNLAELCPATHTLGPGKRFAIWVQGCCFNCRDCISPEWIPQTQGTLVEPKKLAEAIASVPDIVGLTVSGGEPMLQAQALSELFTELRFNLSKRSQKQTTATEFSIVCYTGFTLEELQAKSDPAIDRVLAAIDVSIDGQYIPELNDNRGWRGSTNQRVHFLTSRLKGEASAFVNRPRDVEIHLRTDSALMVGVPPRNFSDKFKQAVESSSYGFR